MTISILLCILITVVTASSCNTLEKNCTSQYECNSHGQQLIGLFPGQFKPVNIPALKGSQPTSVLNSNHNITFSLQYTRGDYPRVTVYGLQGSQTQLCLRNKDGDFEINVTIWYCPPGFEIHNKSSCICNPKIISKNILCHQNLSSNIFVGFCASRANGAKDLLIVRCAVANVVEPLYPLQQDNVSGKTTFCEDFKRKGRLCGECKRNYGVSVYSSTYKCIPCSGNRIKDIMLYLTIELVPTIIFIGLLLLFHIGITSGTVNGFIFFAQMITVPLQLLYLTDGMKIFLTNNNDFVATLLTKIVVDPYCIWNLQFYMLFDPKICLSPKLKIMHILAFQYTSALFPLIFLFITYILIELQARNNRFIMCLWKLCCFPCVHCRTAWRFKTSVVNAFASCILLSYSKFVLVSFYHITYSRVQSIPGHPDHNPGRVLSFDTSVTYFSAEHKPFIAVAIIINIVFGVLPPVVLTFYQFSSFQNFLACLKLRRQGLQQFMEAFQGCYKDGTDGKMDCRFFAGLYFIFRYLILLVNALTLSFPSAFTTVILTTLFFMFLVAAFQPYKKAIYNRVDTMFLFLLAAVTALQMYTYDKLQHTFVMPKIFLLYYVLLYIPHIYIILYILQWIHQHWNQIHNPVNRHHCRGPNFFRESAMNEECGTPTVANIQVSDQEEQIEQEPADERSNLMERELRNYGTQ